MDLERLDEGGSVSDRRPEKLHDPAKALEWWRDKGSKMAIVEFYEAVTDPVAAVRRGVESGTIEGAWEVPIKRSLAGTSYVDVADHPIQPGWYLVIPVDGEET